jgi:hypothetical protein
MPSKDLFPGRSVSLAMDDGLGQWDQQAMTGSVVVSLEA